MTHWISWLALGLMVAVLFYAIFSLYVRKPAGLYISVCFHIALGILSLPSIGLYVLGLAILELLVGMTLTITAKNIKRHNVKQSTPLFNK